MSARESFMKKYIFAAISTIAVVLWIAFILSNSSQTGAESGSLSKSVCDAINNFFDNVGLNITLSERFLRKAAHFCEYMVLAVLGCADILSFSAFFEGMKQKRKFLWLYVVLPVSAAVALFDEFGVQMMTEGRGPSFRDVLIDTSGAVLGVLAVISVLWLHYKLVGVRKRDVRT